MSVLNDATIVRSIQDGRLGIDPFDPSRVQPASIDLTLGQSFRFYNYAPDSLDGKWVIDPLDLPNDLTYEIRAKPSREGGFITLGSEVFCLATTEEVITIPDDLVARVEGKSSLGRLGLNIHITAGFIDPGFSGRITLELHNINPHAILLRPGMAICQLGIEKLCARAERPYGHPDLKSKYQNQTTTTESRYAG